MNMRLIRTLKLRLQEKPQVFQPTIDAYTKAFNYTCQVGWKDKTHNGVQLHHNVCRDRNEISLSTIEGRKTVQIEVPEFFKQYLSWKRCAADLFVRKEQVFLNIVMEKEIEDPVSNGTFVGVGRGIKKLAVTSDLRFFGGGLVKHISRRYQRLRSVLQSKGHSGKRHFRRISSKENRFRRDVNHVVSKQIVQGLKKGTTLILEKLTGLTSKQVPKMRRKKAKDRERRREHSSWSYYQLEEFLKYKAASRGVLVDYVSACYTSRGCSKCRHIARANRTCQSRFRCKKCGYQVNADLNASFNIVLNYLDAKGHPDRAFQGASCSSHLCVA